MSNRPGFTGSDPRAVVGNATGGEVRFASPPKVSLSRMLCDTAGFGVGQMTLKERVRRWRGLLEAGGWPPRRAWLAAWWVVGFRGRVRLMWRGAA